MVKADVAEVRTEVTSVVARVAALETRAPVATPAGGRVAGAPAMGRPGTGSLGAGSSSSSAPSGGPVQFVPTRVDIKGLTRFENRMQEALTGSEVEVFLRRLIGALPGSSASCLLPLESQLKRNGRVLV